MEMLFFLTWTAFSIAVGMFAHIRRNRNGFGWGVLAFIISPVIAGVFCAILREREGNVVRPKPGFWDGLITRPQRTPTTRTPPIFDELPTNEKW